MTLKVFLNDKLVDIDKAAVSVTDTGLLYGAGLFETMRSCSGVVFALDDHLDRLFASAEALSLQNTCTKEFITQAVNTLLEANQLTDARLRLTLTAGPIPELNQKQTPTLLITAAAFTPYPPEYYEKGVMVILCPFRQNPNDPTCGHKTTNYFSRMLALDLARKSRAAEAIWFAIDNRLAEGCISNVFLVKDSVLYSPPLTTPVLPGIARKTVCTLASQSSLKLVEKDLYIADLLAADEIFLTNVIMQVMPVTSVEKHAVGRGRVGPVTADLAKKFDEFVKTQCRKSQ